MVYRENSFVIQKRQKEIRTGDLNSYDKTHNSMVLKPIKDREQPQYWILMLPLGLLWKMAHREEIHQSLGCTTLIY